MSRVSNLCHQMLKLYMMGKIDRAEFDALMVIISDVLGEGRRTHPYSKDDDLQGGPCIIKQ